MNFNSNRNILRLLRFLLPILLLVWTIPVEVLAQNTLRGNQTAPGGPNGEEGEGTTEEDDPCVQKSDERFCWTQDPITGIHFDQVPDTSYIGLGNRQSMQGKSLGLVHTGNLYSPHYIMD